MQSLQPKTFDKVHKFNMLLALHFYIDYNISLYKLYIINIDKNLLKEE